MNFQQTIFMNNANASSASKGKTQSSAKQSGNSDFYKIIQSMSSSPKDNVGKQVSASNSDKTSVTSADYNAEISGNDDLIDENVINEALGVKTSGTQTQNQTKTEENVGQVKFSAEEVKAIASDREALEKISEMLNIPMEVIEAFISQLALGTMGGETMTGEISAIVSSVMGLYESADASDESLNLTEELTSGFIEELKKFAETSHSERIAQKYADLNEFIDAVNDGLDLNAAARRAVRSDPMLGRFVKNANITDETTEFVTEKILEHLNIDADSLSDFEIVSIEKLLNENISENDNLEALLQKLRNPFAAMTRLSEIKSEIPAAVAVTEEMQVSVETAEVIPIVSISEIENVSDETEIPEEYEPVKVNGDDAINDEMTLGSVPANTAEVKQYPDVITHYTRAANSIQNLIMNNKNGENFQVKMLLRPEGLGEMLVSVTYSKGNINLNVTTDNALAQKELLNQSAELRTTLAEHDFNLMNFDVGNKNPDDRNQSGGNERNGKNKRAGKINALNAETGADLKISNEDIVKLRSIYQNRLLYRQV